MIRLTKTYAKLIDKLTIEEAPEEFNGIIGFKYDAKKCIESGYFPVVFSEKTGSVATYELINNSIVQKWVDIDSTVYAQLVIDAIRLKYSENEEIAILRKAYAGIDKKAFGEYNFYCEKCKKEVKLQMIK